MKKTVIGMLEPNYNVDCYGGDILFVDLYDKTSNKDLYQITNEFHGKRVKIIIEEIIEES